MAPATIALSMARMAMTNARNAECADHVVSILPALTAARCRPRPPAKTWKSNRQPNAFMARAADLKDKEWNQ